jgi:Ran GTPase-activating protein (RanGAP) involved in mRNA processing and transport
MAHNNTDSPKVKPASMLKAPGKKTVGKDSLIGLAFKNWTNCTVDLKGKNVGDSHINEICKNLKSYPSIRVIDLTQNKISDDGVQHLAKAVCESQVEQLILVNNKLTEKCTEPLAGVLKTNKSLKVLDL